MLVVGASRAVSGNPWYVSDGLHPARIWNALQILAAGKTGENGQHFTKDCTSLWDKTVGALSFECLDPTLTLEEMIIDTRGRESLTTGSPVGPRHFSSCPGLMYSLAHVTVDLPSDN